MKVGDTVRVRRKPGWNVLTVKVVEVFDGADYFVAETSPGHKSAFNTALIVTDDMHPRVTCPACKGAGKLWDGPNCRDCPCLSQEPA